MYLFAEIEALWMKAITIYISSIYYILGGNKRKNNKLKNTCIYNQGLHPAASCSYHRGEGPAGVSLYAHGRGGSEQHGFAVEAIDPFPDANPLAVSVWFRIFFGMGTGLPLNFETVSSFSL